MRQARILLLLITLLPALCNAQLVNIIGGATDTIPCNQACKTLYANYIKPNKTNTYQASSIAFNPINLSAPNNLSLLDDKFSGVVQIGFPFCFYENTYTDLYISSNGHITFNSSYSTNNCSFDTKQAIPYYSASYPDNAIFCPFNDGNTSLGGTIQYQTVGSAPFRKFVVQYSNIPYFGTNCNGTPATFQCVLSETTNDIEFFITNKSTCNADTSNWLNYSTLGIQSIGALNHLVVNNRNATIWTANNEGWKIAPAGPPAYTFTWKWGSYTLATNIDSISICDPFPKTITAILTLDCPSVTENDTMRIFQTGPQIDSVLTLNTDCKNTSTGSATIFASGGTPPYSYSINNGPFGSSNQFGNLSMGAHLAQVMDANGCIANYPFIIGVNSTLALNLDAIIQPTCPDSNGAINFSASGGIPPYNFFVNGAPSSSPLQNLTIGGYLITVEDANGCRDSIVANLVWDTLSLPIITDSLVKPVCGDNTGSIYAWASNGTAPYSYLWSTNAVTTSIHNLTSGVYAVTVTDSKGCSSTKGIQLSDTLNMQLQLLSFAHTSCGLNNGMGNSIATNGLPPYSYLWSNSAITPQTNTLAPGWNYITVTDANNCTRIDSLNINSSVALTLLLLPANAYCFEDNGVINTLVTGNSGNINYAWSTNDSTSYIDSLGAGNYSLTITDDIGCTVTDSVLLINHGKPRLVVVDYTPPLCYGDSTGVLSLSGVQGVAPYKYSLDGVNFFTTAVITNFSAGTYTIYMRDANSCESDTTITFDPPKPITINTSAIDTLICFNDLSAPITFSASDGTAPYRWSLDDNNYNTQNTFSDFSIGQNIIYVSDSNNCKNDLIFNVPGPAAPLDIETSVTDVPCYQEQTGAMTIDAIGGWSPYIFSWKDFPGNNTMQSNLSEGTYEVSVTDTKGCVVDSAILLKQLYCCDCYFPNAFTPNTDGNNDVFRAISPAQDIVNYRLCVYNRWGARVFITDNVSGAWDGTINGEPAEIGTYFYQCSLKCQNKNENVFLKGEVILIR